MYGDVLLLERDGQAVVRGTRLPLGETAGRDEAWLRDLLFAHPQLLPIDDMDPSFGQPLPLCRELRTEAGPVDVTFISPAGRLALVECKLWRNPEARRKVVAQVLDYARALTRWSYSDLQRQVSVATKERRNVAFELAHAAGSTLAEHHFADTVGRGLRAGRLLLLIVGDGIREDVAALTELISRNAALGFSFGLIEMALYDLGAMGLAVQPRVTARTQVFERHVVVLQGGGTLVEEDAPAQLERSEASRITAGNGSTNQPTSTDWWRPILEMRFDDPDQESPKLFHPNHVRVPMPWAKTWITAYGNNERPTESCGVFVAGDDEKRREWLHGLEPLDEVLDALPAGTELRPTSRSGTPTLVTKRSNTTFTSSDERLAWLKETINQYVNVLRPRFKLLGEGSLRA